MNQWVAHHTPRIVPDLQLCNILQVVSNLGWHDKKYPIFHWIEEKIENYSDNPLARDGTHQLNDALNDLMHTLQWLQLAATTMLGLQAPARSLVAYQSRHPLHFHRNVFMNILVLTIFRIH